MKWWHVLAAWCAYAGVTLAAVDPADFAAKRRIEITGYAGTETLTHFPVLVAFSESAQFSYAECASPNGHDLRFGLDGTLEELTFDIDRWDTNGTSHVWVRVPALTNGAAFWAYWGNPSDTALPAFATDGSTWSAGFGGVWHMSAIDPLDSSGNGNHGTGYATPEVAPGILGDCLVFLDEGPDDHVRIPDDDSIDPGSNFTASAWVRSTDAGTWYRNIAGNFGSGADAASFWGLGWMGPNNLGFTARVTNQTTQVGGGTLNNGNWHHLVGIKEGPAIRVYADGALVATGIRTGDVANTEGIWVGTHGTYGTGIDGAVDELRVAPVIRSADWIRAAYDTVTRNTSFLKYSDEINAHAATGVTTTGATLNGDLAWATGTTHLAVCWGTGDGGTATTTAWENAASLGAFPAPTTLAHMVSSLAPDTIYTYRFYATNAAGSAWSDPVRVRTRFVDVAGLALWWDASAIPGAADGASVSAWPDWSESGNDGRSDAGLAQPAFVTNGINGRAVVRFDGNTDTLEYDGSVLENTDYTIFLVERRRSLTGGSYILKGTVNAANQNLHVGYRSAEVFTHANYANDYDMAVRLSGPPQPHIYAVLQDRESTHGRRTYRDGRLLGSDGNMTPLADYVGASVGNGLYGGDIAEFIIFNRALSLSEQNEVGRYLAAKYGVDTEYDAPGLDTAAFDHSLDIAFTGYAGAAPLTNFPVCVRLDESRIADFLHSQFASSEGRDLRFSLKGSAQELSHEIEEWNRGGVSTVWVCIPELTSNTTVTAYWGSPAAAAQTPFPAAAGGVWVGGYQAVLTLSSRGGDSALESTPARRTGILRNMTGSYGSGQVGGTLSLNGSNQYITVSYDEPETEVTHSMWVRTTTDNRGVFSIRQNALGGANDRNVTLGGGAVAGRLWNTEIITSPALAVTNGQWHYLVHTFGASVGGQKLYVDGVEQASGTKAASDFDWDNMVHVGYSTTYFEGDFGDVRVASATRSDDWIMAEYKNIADYSNFVDTADVQGPPPELQNQPATLITDTGAGANATLSDAAVPTAVSVHWGTTDAGTGTWDHVVSAGVAMDGPVTAAITGLTAEATYHYRFFASNAFGSAWATSSVSFTAKQTTYYTITPSAGPNGAISPSVPENLNPGEDSSVYTFAPDTGYHLTNVIVDGATALGIVAGHSLTNVTANHSIQALFGINAYTVSVAQTTGGTIAPDPAAPIVHGLNSEWFTVTPTAGYYLVDVLADGVSIGPVSPYRFNGVTGSRVLTARFEAYPLGISPESVAFWLQADKLAENAGDTLDTWPDLSGNTNHLSRAEWVGRPTLTTTGMNGRAAVYFDSTKTMTNAAMNAHWPTHNATVFVVARADTATQSSHLYRSLPWNTTRFSLHLPWANDSFFDYGSSTQPGRMQWGNAGTDQDSIWCFYNEAGAYQAAWRNGTLSMSETTTGTWDPAGYAFEVGATYRGHIAELLILNTALDYADRNAVGFYLQEKYGLATAYVHYDSVDVAVGVTVDGTSPVDLVGGMAFKPGTTVTYTITATNNGPGGATGIVVSNQLPDEVAYQAHGGGAYNPASGEWTVDSLAYGASTSLTVSAVLRPGTPYGPVTNLAALTQVNEAEHNPGNDSASTTLDVWGAVPDIEHYAHKVRIAFPGYTRQETLTNFPALVKLGSHIKGFSYAGLASPVGSDLRFTETDGATPVAYEIESWDPAGESFVWVRLPTLTRSTTIWAYWGYTNALPAADTPGRRAGCVLWLDGGQGVLANPQGAVTNWSDRSGLGHDADVVTGDPRVVTGPNGRSVVHFDGDDYLHTTYSFTPAAYTVFSVSRIANAGVRERVVSSPDGNWLFGFWDGFDERFYANGWIQQTGARNTQWRIHTAAIDSNRRASFWKDGGALALNAGGAGADYQPHRLGMGGYRPGTEMSQCEVAEVILYDRALSEQERVSVGAYLAEKYGIASRDRLPAYARQGTVWTEGYAGVWHLDESSGTHFDAAAGLNATAVSVVNQDAAGVADGADAFGGTHYAEVPYSAAMEGGFVGTNGFTLSAWANASGVAPTDGQPRWLVDMGLYADDGAGIYLRDAGFWGYRHSTVLTATTPQQAGTWYQVALWHNTATLRLYVNGQEEAAAAETGGDMSNNPLRIGAQSKSLQAPRYFTGLLDEVRLSTVPRSPAWIWAAYANLADNETFVTAYSRPGTLLMLR